MDEQPEDSTASTDNPGQLVEAGAPPTQPVQPVYYYPPALPTAPMAIVGMVLGILAVTSMFCYGVPGLIFGIAAIITSRLGLAACRRARGEVQGEGLAIAGLVTGWIGTVAGALALLAIIAYAIFVFYLFQNMPPPTPPTIPPAPSAPAAPVPPVPACP